MKKRFYFASSITLVCILVVLYIAITLAGNKDLGKVSEGKKSLIANGQLNTHGIHKRVKGSTSQRPTEVPQGFVYYDTTLNKPIYWNGEKWVYNSILNIKDFGAKGDGVADDTAVIQRALNIARDFGNIKLYFPRGIYNTTTLRLYKNTYINFDSDAIIRRIGKSPNVFINGKKGDLYYAKGYNGEGNIHIFGGIIDLNTIKNPIPYYKGTTAFDLGHAENISFKNLTIKNGQNGHYFQISSCKSVIFEGCWFGDVQYTNPSSKDYELIQIEEATKISFPLFGGYDGTISRNITVRNCQFENVIRAIGTHSYSRKTDGITPLRYCDNIKITNNVFKNSISQFGHFEAFKNIIFENNILENCGEYPIYVYQSKNNIIKNNYILDSKKSGVELRSADFNFVENNLIIDTCLDTVHPCSGIQGSSSKDNNIINNVIGSTKHNSNYLDDISFKDGSKGNNLKNNEFINGIGSDNNLVLQYKTRIKQTVNLQ
jgi:parallel beta-helix repeat protein